MSGTSPTASTGTLGDAPPVSFPGISSGIDYNSIIQKYTAATLAQEAPTKSQINNLNTANASILKIQNLFGSVQSSLLALSDPATFNAFKPTVSNTASGSPAATATQIAGQTPLAGSYVINAQTAATATQVANSTATANAPLNGANPLLTSGTAITASNGPNGTGKVTINGVQINYDVTTQSIGTIVANINASGAGVTASFNAATQQVTITGVSTLGSGADSGNLLQVFKLDSAQILAGSVTSSSTVSGINAQATLNSANNAGFQTPVTAGTFTINGVQFTVDPTKDALGDVLKRINASSAGVTASYDPTTTSITLTNKTPGPQSILLGSGLDTSNFLTAAALTGGAGATTTAGTQASVTYTNTSGVQATAYSSTNDFTNVIQGIDLHVTSSSPALPPGSTFYTVTVAADPTAAETAIKAFSKAYNAAIDEINKDTAAPVVVTTRSTATGQTQNAQGTAGGPLYGNFQISSLRDQLVTLVSGFIPTGSTSYNSLASIGLKLDTSSQTVGTVDGSDDSSSSSSSSTSSKNNSITVNATSGKLADLDTAAFETAYAANPSAVSALFTLTPALTAGAFGSAPAGSIVPGSGSGLAYSLGSLLANADGAPTFLKGSLISPGSLGNVLLKSITDSNTQQIKSLQQQITLIDQEANQQADALRAQFSASETQIAQLQSLQSVIASIGH